MSNEFAYIMLGVAFACFIVYLILRRIFTEQGKIEKLQHWHGLLLYVSKEFFLQVPDEVKDEASLTKWAVTVLDTFLEERGISVKGEPFNGLVKIFMHYMYINYKEWVEIVRANDMASYITSTSIWDEWMKAEEMRQEKINADD